jgi:hypothetical protein
VLPISGWFANVLGRKWFFMTCLTIFTLSSMLCGIAPSLGALIVFRILQVRPPRSVFDGGAVRGLAGLRRLLLFLFAAGLGWSGCKRMPNQTRMESSPQLESTIAALRGAYQAFNRGDIEAAVEPLDAQIEWTEPVEFPAAAPTTDAMR